MRTQSNFQQVPCTYIFISYRIMRLNHNRLSLGLIESGESGEEAAIRKLKEETGWHGEGTWAEFQLLSLFGAKIFSLWLTVTHCTRALGCDPALTSATVRYATVKVRRHKSLDIFVIWPSLRFFYQINGDSLENKSTTPVGVNEQGEHIDLIMIPLSEIQDRLTSKLLSFIA